jgi:hypothetical protein
MEPSTLFIVFCLYFVDEGFIRIFCQGSDLSFGLMVVHLNTPVFENHKKIGTLK